MDDDAFEQEWSSWRAGTKLKPVRTVVPAVEPVSLAELKQHCRVYHEDDDSDLEAYLGAAIEYLDGYSGILGRALINQTWRVDMSGFCDVMRLPLETVSSVTSVTYYDGDNAQQTLSSDVYGIYTDDRGPYVKLKYAQAWPTTYSRDDAVSITFVAGYGTAAADVPKPIRSAIKLHAAFLYETRESAAEKPPAPTGAYERLIRPYRRII